MYITRQLSFVKYFSFYRNQEVSNFKTIGAAQLEITTVNVESL